MSDTPGESVGGAEKSMDPPAEPASPPERSSGTRALGPILLVSVTFLGGIACCAGCIGSLVALEKASVWRELANAVRVSEPSDATVEAHADRDGNTVIARTGLHDAELLALGADRVYWIDDGGLERLFAVPKAGGEVITIGDPTGRVSGLVVGEDAVWVSTSSGVYRFPLEGGDAVPVASGAFEGLALLDQEVLAGQGPDLVAIHRSTQERRVVWSQPSRSGWSFAPNAGGVVLGAGSGVYRLEGATVSLISEESASEVAPGPAWRTSSGVVQTLGDGALGEAGILRICGTEPVDALAGDGATLWIATHATRHTRHRTRSRRSGIPRSGRSRTTGHDGLHACDRATGDVGPNLAPSRGDVTAIAVDATHIYWIDGREIVRRAREP